MRYWAEAVTDRFSAYKLFFFLPVSDQPLFCSVCAGEIPQLPVPDPQSTPVWVVPLSVPGIKVIGGGGGFRAGVLGSHTSS